MLKKEMMSIKKDEMNSGVRTFKAAMLYTHEYGQAAYQTWLANEAEITKLAKTGKADGRAWTFGMLADEEGISRPRAYQIFKKTQGILAKYISRLDDDEE